MSFNGERPVIIWWQAWCSTQWDQMYAAHWFLWRGCYSSQLNAPFRELPLEGKRHTGTLETKPTHVWLWELAGNTACSLLAIRGHALTTDGSAVVSFCYPRSKTSKEPREEDQVEPLLVRKLASGEVFLVQLPCENSHNHTDLGLESGRWSLSLIFIPVPTHLGDNDKVTLVSRNPEHGPLECPGSGVHRHCFLESGCVQGLHRHRPSTLTNWCD